MLCAAYRGYAKWMNMLSAGAVPGLAQGRHLVRFYGGYSNKNRGLRKKQPLLQMPYSATTAVGPEIVEPSASVAITSAGRPPNDSPDDDDDFRRDCRRTSR